MKTPARHVYASPFAPVSIPEVSITEGVLAHAARLADKPALVDAASGRTLTYGALREQVQHFATNLASCGFRPGDVVAILMPNLPEYAVVFHGVVLAGGVCTTVNPGYTAGEIHDQCLDAGATRLVTVPACLDVARAAAAGTAVQEILVVGGEPAAIAAAAARGACRRHRWSKPHAVRGDAAGSRARRVAAAARGIAGRARRAAVFLGHHRQIQGRDAHASQPGGERRAGVRRSSTCARPT